MNTLPPPQPKKQSNPIAGLLGIAVILFGVWYFALRDDSPTAGDRTTPRPAIATRVPTRAPVATSVLSRSQANAIRKAESYLSYSAFSRSGLIDQLEYEGFTVAEATYAVDHINVDWNEQAWKKAESYLDYSAFSHSALIEQLEYEGFTHSQAVYGVDKAGL